MLISQRYWEELYERMHVKSCIVNHKPLCKCKDRYALDICSSDALKYLALFTMTQVYLHEHLVLTNQTWLSVACYQFNLLSRT